MAFSIIQKSIGDIPKSYDANYQAAKIDFQFDKGKKFKKCFSCFTVNCRIMTGCRVDWLNVDLIPKL